MTASTNFCGFGSVVLLCNLSYVTQQGGMVIEDGVCVIVIMQFFQQPIFKAIYFCGRNFC